MTGTSGRELLIGGVASRLQLECAATIRGRRLFRLWRRFLRRLFEGGDYSRAASDRGNTVLGW